MSGLHRRKQIHVMIPAKRDGSFLVPLLLCCRLSSVLYRREEAMVTDNKKNAYLGKYVLSIGTSSRMPENVVCMYFSFHPQSQEFVCMLLYKLLLLFVL